MLKYNEFLYEADVAQTLRKPAGETPAPTPGAPVESDLSKKIGELITKVKGGSKPSEAQKPSTGGVNLDKNTKYITIEGENGDKYELSYGGEITGKVQANKSYPTYSIKTDDEEIKRQSKQFLVVDDDTYGKITFILENINKWKTGQQPNQPNQQTPPVQQPEQQSPATNPATQSTSKQESIISKFSDLTRIYEEVQNLDSIIVSNFTNSRTYGKYPNWKEVAGALGVLKEKYPTLYGKSLGDLIKLMKNKSIVKESEKTKFITRWFILKHSDAEKQYFLVRSGKPIQNGDTICFQKYVTKGKGATTKPFKVKNALVEKAEAPTPEQKF